MTTFNLVKDDTAPQIKATITREDTGAVVNMSGGTVKLKFREKNSSTILFTLTASTAGDNLQNGIAIFVFGSGDLSVSAGDYEGEIELTHSDGTVETIFELLNFLVREDF
jgi:hypothetical protein